MNEHDKNFQTVFHIIKYCEKIKNTAETFQHSKINFKDKYNYVSRDACAFYILQIGELTTNLTEEFKSKHDEIPWKAIKAMRNVVAHKYGQINIDTTWETITNDIPNLNKLCKKILRENHIDFEQSLKKELKNEIGYNNGIER
ncbi:MAG: HepT-like ribonuclease domain-containing protein [Smithella sp.]